MPNFFVFSSIFLFSTFWKIEYSTIMENPQFGKYVIENALCGIQLWKMIIFNYFLIITKLIRQLLGDKHFILIKHEFFVSVFIPVIVYGIINTNLFNKS